tara:strand:- start:1543 stop:1797 length:255 start_codon:yes stop_codon:yes gene_type:complete
MSYILFSSGSSLATPVSIANGGTGNITAPLAMNALTSTAFSTSSQNINWGSTVVDSPILPADLDNVADVVDQLILALNDLGVLG